MATATGTFEVRMTPTEGSAAEGAGVIDRLVLDKTYAGDLEATAKGQMLATTTATDGSAGYVAIEHVEGRVAGREGGFVLQHHGLMDRGAPTLVVPIVPDSGTGALIGIAGEMTIDIAEDGTHTYTLTYELGS